MSRRSLLSELLRRSARPSLVACALLCALPAFAQVTFEGSVTVTGKIYIANGLPTPPTSLEAETAINTAACGDTATEPWCYNQWGDGTLNNLTTASANTNAQTQLLTPVGQISPLTIPESYLYPDFAGQVIFTGQPWFSMHTGTYPCYFYPTGGYTSTPPSPYNGHPCPGYSENNQATILAQMQEMIRVGQGGQNTVVRDDDWYGNVNGDGWLNNSVMQEATVAGSLCTGTTAASCPILFGIMVDGNGIPSGMKACTGTASYYCPAGAVNAAVSGVSLSSVTTAQFVAYFESILDYIDTSWGNKPYYAPSPAGNGHHELLTFISSDSSHYQNVNFTTAWAEIASYMKKYKAPYDIYHWSGGFTTPNQAGAYLWVKPYGGNFSNSSPLTQFTLDSGNGYQANFYTAAQASSQIGCGGLSIGFDGSNNNYGQQGLMSREWGRTLLFYSSKILNALPRHYGTGTGEIPLPCLLVATWNDHGEGTNAEGGVDNGWRMNTPSYNGGTGVLTWTLANQDTAYDPNFSLYGPTVETIDHFDTFFGNSTGTILYYNQKNISPTAAGCSGTTMLTCSFNIQTANTPPYPGFTWYLYVKMVPKALLLTQMNGGGNGNGAPLSQSF